MSHLSNSTIRDRRGRINDNNAFYHYYTHPPPFCQDNNNHYFHPQQQGPQQQCYPYLQHPHHPSPFSSCDFVHSPGLKEVVTSFFPPSTAASSGINVEQRKPRYPNQYWILLGVLFLIIILLGICLIWIGHQGANSNSRDCHDEAAEKVIIINNNHKADYAFHHVEGGSDNVNLEIQEEPVLKSKAVTFSLNDEEETTVETVEM